MKPWFPALALAALAAPAAAQLAPGSSDAPIDITGESLEIVDDVATWTGDVRAVQAEAILTSERLVADLEAGGGGFRRLRAEGQVRYDNGKETIAGSVGVYDADARTITVTGDVVVTQGDTVMTGSSLVYWIDTGRIRFNAAEGGRIRGVFRADGPAPKV